MGTCFFKPKLKIQKSKNKSFGGFFSHSVCCSDWCRHIMRFPEGDWCHVGPVVVTEGVPLGDEVVGRHESGRGEWPSWPGDQKTEEEEGEKKPTGCRLSKFEAEGKGLFHKVETETLRNLFISVFIADRDNEE